MSNERRIVILYGSQTGTAQDVAERIERDAIRRHLSVVIKPLNHYDVVSIVVFSWMSLFVVFWLSIMSFKLL